METNGTPDWTKSKAGQHLQERLNNEQTLRSIDHLLERMDTLENAIDRLATLMEQAMDEEIRYASDRGVSMTFMKNFGKKL